MTRRVTVLITLIKVLFCEKLAKTSEHQSPGAGGVFLVQMQNSDSVSLQDEVDAAG